MLRHSVCYLWVSFVVLAAAVTPALADEVKGYQADNETLASLEAVVQAQQARIDLLKQQLVDDQQHDQNAMQNDALRQQIRAVLSDQEFSEGLVPATLQAGYDGGFFIRSNDAKFNLRINGRVQFRWVHYATRATNRWRDPGLQRNDRTGFSIPRLRVGFRGHAYSKDLTFRVELDGGAGNRYSFRPYYAWVTYRFRDEFQFMVGLFKIPATRAQFTSDGDLQFVDRSMTDGVFQLGRGIGVQFWGFLFDRRVEYYLDIVNSLNGATNVVIGPDEDSPTGTEMDSNPAITFRAVWHALGENPGKDLKAQSDLEFHESPALSLGFHYAFNEDEGDSSTISIPYPLPRRFARGGFGLTNTNGMQINQFGLDAAFKWQGLYTVVEYYLRIVDPRRAGRTPYTSWWTLTGQGDTTVMHGAYMQVGYFLPIPGLERKLEAAARVGGISTAASERECAWEYALGLSYYIKGHKVKLQTDVTRIFESPIRSGNRTLANVNDDALFWRVQLQVKF